MKFSVKQSHIRNILSKVQGVTGRKTTLAITETVRIEAEGSGLKITATDLETGFEGYYAAGVDEEGTIAVNAKKLFEIVRDYPKETIEFNEVENRWIYIGDEKLEYQIMGMNPSDFPETPKFDDAPLAPFPAAHLREMIEKTVFITGAPDDKRSHIHGCYLETVDTEEGRGIRMVSTDGNRLSSAEYPFPAIEGGEEVNPFEFGILIPKKGLNEVARFLEPNTEIRFGVKDDHFIVKSEAETITIRLMEGDFPAYADIIRSDMGKEILLDREMFTRMLKRMTILSTDDFRGVVFNFKANRLLINTTNPDLGESKEDMVIVYEDEPIEVAFNPKFFIESLTLIDDDTVTVRIEDDERPCLLLGVSDKSFINVIMPMKI